MGAGREQVLREGLQDSTLRRGSGQAQRKQQGTVKGTQVAERPPGCRGGRGEGGERGGRVRPEVGHGRRQNAGKKGSVGWGGAERAGVKMWGCRPDAVHAPPGNRGSHRGRALQDRECRHPARFALRPAALTMAT